MRFRRTTLLGRIIESWKHRPKKVTSYVYSCPAEWGMSDGDRIRGATRVSDIWNRATNHALRRWIPNEPPELSLRVSGSSRERNWFTKFLCNAPVWPACHQVRTTALCLLRPRERQGAPSHLCTASGTNLISRSFSLPTHILLFETFARKTLGVSVHSL